MNTEQSSLTAEHVIKVLKFLCSRLDADERFKVLEFAQSSRNLGGDEPPDFPGKPLTGGAQVPLRPALDALPRSARKQAAEALFQHDAAARASYAQMYPGAPRLGAA